MTTTIKHLQDSINNIDRWFERVSTIIINHHPEMREQLDRAEHEYKMVRNKLNEELEKTNGVKT